MNKNSLIHPQNLPQRIEDPIFREMPRDPALIADMAYEFVELGQYQEAYECFCFGISLDDSDPDLLNGLGITLCEMGELEKSRIILERSVRLDPENSITLANLAGVFWEMGQLEQAVYYYRKSLDFDRDIEETHLNLINCYLEMGLLYIALLACIEFRKLFPDHEEGDELLDDIILNLGISLY
ncbi:MAG: tetratricopeptide repeat protein [Spirochaetes bacterium]|nr:tetratricopeptide repeat protein [Spirochaetota bacterium]